MGQEQDERLATTQSGIEGIASRHGQRVAHLELFSLLLSDLEGDPG